MSRFSLSLAASSAAAAVVAPVASATAAPPTCNTAVPPVCSSAPVNAAVGGLTPGVLSLSISSTASLGAFVPGIDATGAINQPYSATVAGTVTPAAANAILTVADLSSPAGIAGHMYNSAGSGYSLNSAPQASGSSSGVGAVCSTLSSISAAPLTLITSNTPIANDTPTVTLAQSVAATDPLRTGTYSKILTFTLSSTTL